jgi:hypothetical protein
MAADVAGFRARFAEFSDETAFPDSRIQIALDDAALQINRGLWGNKADLGTYYLAAHELTLNDPAFSVATGGGAITSETVGSVSRSYSAPSQAQQEQMGTYSWTKYGLRFWALKRQILGTPVVL